jgi:hypothetical protein
MSRFSRTVPWFIAILVALATSVALCWPSDGSPQMLLTIRGEQALFSGRGLYRFDPLAVAREGLVWDTINLCVGVPLFLAAAWVARKGSLGGRIARAGFHLYFAYAYLMYATMMAFNVLFPVYVAIFALSLSALCADLAGLDHERVKAAVTPRFPRRFFAGFCFVTAFLLVTLWGLRIVAILDSGRFPPELAGTTTLVTQALDLGIVVPLAIASGTLLLRDSAWGYVLTGLTLTFAFMMSISIPAWILVPLLREGRVNAGEALPFLAVCAVALGLAILFARSLRETASRAVDGP